jgi:hypothetical protein
MNKALDVLKKVMDKLDDKEKGKHLKKCFQIQVKQKFVFNVHK